MTNSMQKIDTEFRLQSGITERRFYKIYYSHVHPFPLLVLGQNPGGETDGTDLAASDSYFENWEHDYLCFRNDSRYALARPMSALLSAVLQTNSVDTLRQVPASNVIFRRSRNTAALNVSPVVAAKESAATLQKLLKVVNPSAVLLISTTAYKLFTRVHCVPHSIIENVGSRIFTPNGTSPACIFQTTRAQVVGLNRSVPLFMVGHPSKYGGRVEWPSVVDSLKQELQSLEMSPLKKTVLVRLSSIASYGATI